MLGFVVLSGVAAGGGVVVLGVIDSGVAVPGGVVAPGVVDSGVAVAPGVVASGVGVEVVLGVVPGVVDEPGVA